MSKTTYTRHQLVNARVMGTTIFVPGKTGGWEALGEPFATAAEASRHLASIRPAPRIPPTGGGNQAARRAWARLATGRW